MGPTDIPMDDTIHAILENSTLSFDLGPHGLIFLSLKPT